MQRGCSSDFYVMFPKDVEDNKKVVGGGKRKISAVEILRQEQRKRLKV